MTKKTLEQLYSEHVGKVSDKWSIYFNEYNRILGAYRNKPIRLLEIGVQNGGSLEVWGKYFSNAKKIVGCDIDKKCEQLCYDDPRITVVVGDANSDNCQQRVLQQSAIFDIIVDDGSHKTSDIVRSFSRYFPCLNDGGIYVAEDLHCSYWEYFEGGLYNPYSSIAFFKRLADVVNYEHWRNNKPRKDVVKEFTRHFGVDFDSYDLSRIHSIEFVNSLCIIKKLPPEKNVIGKRVIVGTEECVTSGWHELNFTSIQDISVDIKDDEHLDVFGLKDNVSMLTQALADQDVQIASLNQVVAERDVQIASLNQVVAERDVQIASLNQVVAERDGQITALSHAAAERNMQIAGLRSNLDEILRSRSWRLTAPLRYVRHHVRGFKRIGLFLLQTMKLNGGLVSTARKVLRIYWREGRVSVKRRVLFNWKTTRVYLRSTVPLPVRLPEAKRKPQLQVDHLDSDSINYYGYIRAESGLGAACRGYIRALQHHGRKVCPINLPCGLREVEFPVQSTPNTSAMFNIVHMNADSIPYFFGQMGEDCLDGRYNIGLWVCELAALNPEWFQSFLPFQEIWVPSEFCRQSVSAISPIPVYVIPHLVTRVGDEHTNHRGYFNLPEHAFVFGYIFDCSSYIARKNPFALIEAFQHAFEKNENARLLLKMSNGERDPVLYRRIREAIDRHPRILTIERSLNETELGWFFDALDCYVSPHRSEGFGLTLAEAMLARKPVIATDYGGTTDFLKSEHAYPVRYNLVPIREQHGPYLPGYLWAEPDIDHLVERLREVYERPEIARSRGEVARRFVNEQYSLDRVAALMRDRFQEILRIIGMMRHG